MGAGSHCPPQQSSPSCRRRNRPHRRHGCAYTCSLSPEAYPHLHHLGGLSPCPAPALHKEGPPLIPPPAPTPLWGGYFHPPRAPPPAPPPAPLLPYLPLTYPPPLPPPPPAQHWGGLGLAPGPPNRRMWWFPHHPVGPLSLRVHLQ